jgi:hypothetical protein
MDTFVQLRRVDLLKSLMQYGQVSKDNGTRGQDCLTLPDEPESGVLWFVK